MFKIMYTVTCSDTRCSEIFRDADEMRDWVKASGLMDAVEEGKVKDLVFLRAAVNPSGFWKEVCPAWLWT